MEMNEAPLVTTAANVFRQLCYNYRDQMTAGIICAGWDKRKGGQVYCIPLGGMVVRQPISIGGSGSTYVYGYVDANFREGMSRDECMDLVTKSNRNEALLSFANEPLHAALALAMSRDGSSGGVIRLGIITKDGIERKIIRGAEIPKFYEG